MVAILQDDVTQGFYEELASSRRVAWDIETSGLDPRSDRIGTVQLHADATGSVIVQVGPTRPVLLCRLLANDSVEKVFHHAVFDLRFMVARWQAEPANIGCTKVASKLLHKDAPRDRHTLRSLLRHYLDVEIDKSQRASDWMARELTPDQVAYAANDVRHLLPLSDQLTKELAARDLVDLYESCRTFVPARVLLDLGTWSDVFLY
jgi:ribonuclease D